MRRFAGIFVCLLLILSVMSVYSRASDKRFNPDSLDRADLNEYVENISTKKVSEAFQIDLTGDGGAEELIGVLCGNGGCVYYVFMNLGAEKYKFSGSVFLQKSGFEVLSNKRHGFHDILAYTHLNARTGNLFRLEFNGSKYLKTVSFIVNPELFELLRPEKFND